MAPKTNGACNFYDDAILPVAAAFPRAIAAWQGETMRANKLLYLICATDREKSQPDDHLSPLSKQINFPPKAFGETNPAAYPQKRAPSPSNIEIFLFLSSAVLLSFQLAITDDESLICCTHNESLFAIHTHIRH
jgi:hypothetical protein